MREFQRRSDVTHFTKVKEYNYAILVVFEACTSEVICESSRDINYKIARKGISYHGLINDPNYVNFLSIFPDA